MRMTDRVRDIIEMNLVDHYIPLLVKSDGKLFPMYYARLLGENKIAFPITNATGMDSVLKEPSPATAIVADREGGFEAYALNGRASLVTDASGDDDLMNEVRNDVPGFPIHGAVVFSIDSVQLMPPP